MKLTAGSGFIFGYTMASIFCAGLTAAAVSNLPSIPRWRVGSLPFPVPMTFFTTPRPEMLGLIADDTWTSALMRRREINRGIFYTEKAGFIDLAHVLDAADWTRYASARVSESLKSGTNVVELPRRDGGQLLIHLDFPQWKFLPIAQRDVVAFEFGLAAGQEAALALMTWHEIITWFGFRQVWFINEKPSAFTYDDPISHLIGVRAAGVAIRRRGNWEGEIRKAVAAELQLLGVVSAEEARLAVKLVEGKWWRDGDATRRMVESGLTCCARPWLVREMRGSDELPVTFPPPNLSAWCGDGNSAMRLELKLIDVPQDLWRALPERPAAVDPHLDYGRILRRIAFEVEFQYGTQATQPYDVND